MRTSALLGLLLTATLSTTLGACGAVATEPAGGGLQGDAATEADATSPANDAGSVGDADAAIPPAASGAARCWPDDSNPGYDLSCRVTSEICVHDYAGISSYPRPNSCQPLDDACKTDRTCECVTKHFQCGIMTSCSVLPSGLVRVVCQPD